jgi:hypothetical protein
MVGYFNVSAWYRLFAASPIYECAAERRDCLLNMP